MRSAYLLVATIAVVFTAKAHASDIIWYPVDDEEGVFISIYGEKYRSSGPSKWYRDRSGKYTDYFQSVNDHSLFTTKPFLGRHKRDAFNPTFDPFQYQNFPGNENGPFANPRYFDFPGSTEFFNRIFDHEHPSRSQPAETKPLRQSFFRPGTNTWSSGAPSSTFSRPATAFHRPDNSIWSDNGSFAAPSRPHRPFANRPNRPQKPHFSTEFDFGRPNVPFNDGLVFPSEAGNNVPQTVDRPFATTPTLPDEPPTMSQCERTCPVTPEFNPVCGSDYTTYSNIGRLKCAQKCGKGVAVVTVVTCAPSDGRHKFVAIACSHLCPDENHPVCAVDAQGLPKTFANRCFVDFAYCREGKYYVIMKEGEC